MKNVDFNEIDKKVADNTLTEKDVNSILDTMREISETNSDLKILNEIKTNPLKPGEEGTIGGFAKAQVKIDPISGEKTNLTEDPEILSEEELNKPFIDRFNALLNNTDLVYNIDITIEDIINKTKEIFNIPDDQEEEFKLSSYEAQQILNVITKLKYNDKVNIYNEMPDTIKNLIDLTMKKKGFGTKSIESKTMRNRTCLEIISAYITSITKEKYDNSVSKLMEILQEEDNFNVYDTMEDYEKHKQEVLKSLIEVSENDPEKQQQAQDMLDSIKDGLEMTRLISYANKCKLKTIDIEKPQARIFNTIESKYRYSENLHIPSLNSVCNILMRHNKRSLEDNLKFFLVLSKACMNYDINNYTNHLFIYSVIQNIVYLDIYNGEKYEKYSKILLGNINKIIDSVR